MQIQEPCRRNFVRYSHHHSLDVERHCYVSGTAGVLGILPKKVDSKYLLALINSKLFDFYLKLVTPIKADGYFKYSADSLGDGYFQSGFQSPLKRK